MILKFYEILIFWKNNTTTISLKPFFISWKGQQPRNTKKSNSQDLLDEKPRMKPTMAYIVF